MHNDADVLPAIGPGIARTADPAARVHATLVCGEAATIPLPRPAMPTSIETFTASHSAAGGSWSRTYRPSPLASLGLILVALIALPLAVVLLALAVLLVVLLAAVIMVAAGITRIDPGGPGGADAEGRVNVRVRRPDA